MCTYCDHCEHCIMSIKSSFYPFQSVVAFVVGSTHVILSAVFIWVSHDHDEGVHTPLRHDLCLTFLNISSCGWCLCGFCLLWCGEGVGHEVAQSVLTPLCKLLLVFVFQHHRKKLQGRRLDFDCKRRRQAKGTARFNLNLFLFHLTLTAANEMCYSVA
jgi:hypothetical protein